ncbi:MAG: 1-deoxy-D-xylulose-5-phosphate reductoisomerase [Chloroflexi bacterium]|nr:1-deoxy-D-xylulose-5-phosphate reductoisomerase [Chloroflexota bacterium]
MGRKVKRLAVLGSTGSIGRQTLDVVRAFPDRLKVVGLAAGRNRRALEQQAGEFGPEWLYLEGAGRPEQDGCKWISMEEMACLPEVDMVVVATAGRAGLLPTLSAIRAGKTVALANKEVLVMAGELVMAEALQWGARLLPLDSEHSAIWQCLRGEKGEAARVLLTASGGPFRNLSAKELSRVTAADALKHPVWEMGPKVTVDSATLMNKGMEAIEAHWLFDLSWDKIQVVLHPQSLVHSLVEFRDGSLKAQMGAPDMRLPIQYALSYPERWANPVLPRMDWSKPLSLTFESPAVDRFPCLRLALEAGKLGGTYPAVLAAADDVAVELFLDGRISFVDIPRLIERTLEGCGGNSGIRRDGRRGPTLEAILEADASSRVRAREIAGAIAV